MKHRDKALHLVAGLLITVVFGLLHPITGLAVCVLVAWAKEDFDRQHPDTNSRDGWDAYATTFGAVPGQLLLNWPPLQSLSAALWAAVGVPT